MLYAMASDGAGASASGGVWVAPADRPRGRRGLRAWLACATALASLAAFVASRMGSGGTGSGGIGRGHVDYALDGPAWARYALVAIALGLLLAAGLLWAARHRDVVLLDVHMPGGGGLAVLSAVAAELPAVRFLALSMSDAPEDVIEIVHAGARGYVTKTIPADDLAEAVRRVAEGDAVFSPRLAGFVLDAFAGADGVRAAPLDPELAQLTPREREVLHLIARGYLYKEAAQELGISTKTVETHVSAVLRRLQLSNRHQLTRWAAERRLVD
jgi:DNA-binding NarL/FixJ family response regulator